MKPIPIAPALTPEWFAARDNCIGASEIAAAAGLSPYETPLSLYARKRGELPPIEDNDAMRMGRLLEPVVKSEFLRETGLQLIDPTPAMFRHAKHEPITATPDGIIDDSTLLECKTASWRMKGQWGDQDSDSVPDHYLCQCQQQMAVMDAELVHLAVLFDGAELKKFRVIRNEKLIEMLILAGLELWDRIKTGRAPDPTWGHDTTPSLIREIHKNVNDVRIELSPDACQARRRYEELADAIKTAEKEQKECQSLYEHEIGDNFAGVLDDGRMIRRKWIEGGHRSFDVAGRFDYRAVKFDGGPILHLTEGALT